MKPLHWFVTIWLLLTGIGLGVLLLLGERTFFTGVFIGMEFGVTLIFLGLILWHTNGL